MSLTGAVSYASVRAALRLEASIARAMDKTLSKVRSVSRRNLRLRSLG